MKNNLKIYREYGDVLLELDTSKAFFPKGYR